MIYLTKAQAYEVIDVATGMQYIDLLEHQNVEYQIVDKESK